MRGLGKGSQSSNTAPVLQLLVRSGQAMADITEGTFTIDDITSVAGTVTPRVTSTSFNIADAPTGHRLGLGRYAITTGVTSSWTVGSHRVVCAYKLIAGGPVYTQVIEFELLDPGDWPTGVGYVGLIASRQCLQDGVAPAAFPVRTLQKYIRMKSLFVLEVTGRPAFEPLYGVRRLTGSGTPMQILDEPVIAVEDVFAASGAEEVDLVAYDRTSYRVYNRHLDGYLADDDRFCPKLLRLGAASSGETYALDCWPDGTGEHNLLVKGIWGFTDPDPDPNGARVLLGHTPDEIAQVVASLVYRHRRDPLLVDAMAQNPGNVKSVKTRSQAITFGTAVQAGGESLTGDPVLDRILIRYRKPARAVYADDFRRYYRAT